MILTCQASEKFQHEDISSTTKQTRLLNLPSGIIGFSQYTQWRLELLESGPLYVMTVLPNENLHFYLINPYLIRKDYILDISEEDYALLGHPKEENIAVLSIVTLQENTSPTCNLLGPLLIDTSTGIACQSVNNGDTWGTKHLIATGERYTPR